MFSPLPSPTYTLQRIPQTGKMYLSSVILCSVILTDVHSSDEHSWSENSSDEYLSTKYLSNEYLSNEKVPCIHSISWNICVNEILMLIRFFFGGGLPGVC